MRQDCKFNLIFFGLLINKILRILGERALIALNLAIVACAFETDEPKLTHVFVTTRIYANFLINLSATDG